MADTYEAYLYEVGIKPLIAKAMGVQHLREDRDGETEFITISYWESIPAMSRFTGRIYLLWMGHDVVSRNSFPTRSENPVAVWWYVIHRTPRVVICPY